MLKVSLQRSQGLVYVNILFGVVNGFGVGKWGSFLNILIQ